MHHHFERQVCRHHLFHVSQSGSRTRRAFYLPDAQPQYAPDTPFRREHVALDVAVDPKRKTVEGTVTHRLRTLGRDLTEIRLDQIGLQIKSAKVDGKDVEFSVDSKSLVLRLPASPKIEQTLEVVIAYRVEQPARGLYFTGPDADYPQKPHQVWSQGQDQDNRYWIPLFDYPNQKSTTEIKARVPKGYLALSNGALLSKKEQGEWTEFHYRLGVPHVSYLMTLVVGEFSAWSEKGPRGLPIEYYVEAGREADGKRAFSRTPKMLDVFEKKTGISYPYEKYSQVAVQDFIFGGMENTSATTQTDLTLHDARAHLDFSSDPLVSHELAHQWFGNWVTCRDWSHGWLNEGFATFMERVWIENNSDNDGGPDEAQYFGHQDLEAYLSEDSGAYRRPIVSNLFVEPIDIFDAHLYQKGGLVLNLIRSLLGEEDFWRSVQLYLKRHEKGSVETIDLIRAIEDTTGRNLRRVFDQWVFGAGHPEFELTYEYSADKSQITLLVEQKQTGGLPSVTKDGATTHLFQLPVWVEWEEQRGSSKVMCREQIELTSAKDRFFFKTQGKPLRFRFDPGSVVPKTLKFPRPKELLIAQLERDTDCLGRIEAAQELGRLYDNAPAEIRAALVAAIKKDPFWAVRAEVAVVLADLRGGAPAEVLPEILAKEKHPKARRGIVQALAKSLDPQAFDVLKKHAKRDESYFVEARAITAVAEATLRAQRLDLPALSEAELEEFLIEQLRKPSYRDVIRSAALRALGGLPRVRRGESTACTEIMNWARARRVGSKSKSSDEPSHSADIRSTALGVLGSLARTAPPLWRAQIFEFLAEFVDRSDFRLRSALVRALESSGCAEAAPLLGRVYDTDSDGRVKRDAFVALEGLSRGHAYLEPLSGLKAQQDKLDRELLSLKDTIQELKAAKTKRAAAGSRSRRASPKSRRRR